MKHPFYCSVPLEFIQPWAFEARLRQIKELQLGNMTLLNIAFHVGNSEADRRQWKDAFPSLAERIDATPKFEARPEHGMPVVLTLPLDFYLEQLRLCHELGLAVMCYPTKRTDLSPHEAALLTAAGEDCVLADGVFMEALSKLGSGYSMEHLQTIHTPPFIHDAAPALPGKPFPLPETADQLNLQIMHDWFLHPYRQEIEKLRAMGGRQLFMAVEASTQMHLAMEAGCNLPVLELVPHDVYPGLAATRGAAKAYNAPFWGVHTALGYYQSPTNEWTAERLQIAYNLFYAAGASLFSEPNIALQNVGLCSAFFSIPASPPRRLGEEECRSFDDPICVRGREVLAEHYRFTRFHQRPDNGPKVKMGVVMGHLDSYSGGEQEYVWCVADPAFAAGAAEATWHHFDRMFDTESWYSPPRKYYWQADPAKPLCYGTPPCGQLDIVPLEAPLEVLQSYGCLVFLGWNTMTPEYYEKLQAYVYNGGRLLMSVPHLSTRLRRDAEPTLIHDGDFSDLFGTRVLGPGGQVEEILMVGQSTHDPYVLPVGTLYLEDTPLAALEVNNAHILAHSRGDELPVLLENRYGKGVAWLLAVWDYPGQRLDAFITDLLRTMAEGEQDDIKLEGEGAEYSVYESSTSDGQKLTTVYLVNKSIYGQPHFPQLIAHDNKIPVRIGGYSMRIAWVYRDELLISPESRFVQVTDVLRREAGYTVKIKAEAAIHRVQLAALRGAIRHVEVKGQRYLPAPDMEGALYFECHLDTDDELTVYLK